MRDKFLSGIREVNIKQLTIQGKGNDMILDLRFGNLKDDVKLIDPDYALDFAAKLLSGC